MDQNPTQMMPLPHGCCRAAMWHHIPDYACFSEWVAVALSHGLDVTCLYLSEANPAEHARLNTDPADLSGWRPTKEDWQLAAIMLDKTPTGVDGCALFVTPFRDERERRVAGARCAIGFADHLSELGEHLRRGLALRLLLDGEGNCAQNLANSWGRLLWQSGNPPDTDPNGTISADMGDGWTLELDLALDWDLNGPSYRRMAGSIIRYLSEGTDMQLKGDPT